MNDFFFNGWDAALRTGIIALAAYPARKHGYDYWLVSENIAYVYNSLGFKTEELEKKFFEGWKNSPGHRENMLDPDVLETGLAIAQSAETGNFYAVQMFAKPRSKAVEFKIENKAETMVEYNYAGQMHSLPPRYTRTHTACRVGKVAFSGEGKEIAAEVQPGQGDHFMVVQAGADKIEVKKVSDGASGK